MFSKSSWNVISRTNIKALIHIVSNYIHIPHIVKQQFAGLPACVRLRRTLRDPAEDEVRRREDDGAINRTSSFVYRKINSIYKLISVNLIFNKSKFNNL